MVDARVSGESQTGQPAAHRDQAPGSAAVMAEVLAHELSEPPPTTDPLPDDGFSAAETGHWTEHGVPLDHRGRWSQPLTEHARKASYDLPVFLEIPAGTTFQGW